MDTDKITISKSDLVEILKEEFGKLVSQGDALDVDMNKMDRIDNSDGSAFTKSDNAGNFEKKKANMENGEVATSVDMNKQDKDQGHDEEISAAVKVDAASSSKKGTKDNPHIEGMKNSNFDSKKGNPKASSDPYGDRKENVEMNSQDKVTDEGTKTFVEAGAEVKGGEMHTTGQKKAVASEKAKNEEEKEKRIASAIELPEGFKNKKEMIDFINENAKKISKLL